MFYRIPTDAALSPSGLGNEQLLAAKHRGASEAEQRGFLQACLHSSDLQDMLWSVLYSSVRTLLSW